MSGYIEVKVEHCLLSMFSDSTVEHRVLDTRTFHAIFEYSNFQVIDPSIRVFIFPQNFARICLFSNISNIELLLQQSDNFN